MSEELLKIADGLLAVSEGVRALAGKAHSCNCCLLYTSDAADE